MFLLFGCLVAGALTVLAPCVLPLLPVIIGGSLTGAAADKRRPLIITASLAISLLVFTLLLKVTTLFINVPPTAITLVSGTIILILGILTLFPLSYSLFMAKIGFEGKAQSVLSSGASSKNKVFGAIIIGAALGPVFSSCSPVYAYILATVLPANFGVAMAYIIAYIIGLSLTLLLVSFYGQRFIRKVRFASNPNGWFQRTIAILFIITGLLIMTGYDKKFQTYVSTHTPFNFDAISQQFLPSSKNTTDNSQLLNVKPTYAAPEFTGINDWINSSPQTIASLKGKVVLVDFWTYSCINCIRNNPYLEKWYETYKDDGLVVIGVHAPEFAFEKVKTNVEKGVKDQHITYPVAMDNDFATWNAYNNRSWPASYLIDKDGQVRRIHEGEGEYAEEEQAIRQLLEARGAKLGSVTTTQETAPINSSQTPETYLGTDRASNYAGTPALGAAATNTFTLPAGDLAKNAWALGGTWDIKADKITARGNAKLKFHVAAKDVYVVGGSDVAANITVLLGGKPISGTNAAGADVKNSMVTIGQSQLYRLVSFPTFTTDQTVELDVPNGVSLNVFTFGG